jgi:hypothetical protein
LCPISVSRVRGLLVRRPWFEREQPKGDEVEARNDGEQAPNWMMTCATKELYDWDEKEKEENEQHNIGVRKRVRFHHLFLQESTRRGLELSTEMCAGTVTLLTPG